MENSNVSVSVKLLFMYNESIEFAISYLADFKLTGFN